MGKFSQLMEGALARAFPLLSLPSEREGDPLIVPTKKGKPYNMDKDYVPIRPPDVVEDKDNLWRMALDAAEEQASLMFQDNVRLKRELDELHATMARKMHTYEAVLLTYRKFVETVRRMRQMIRVTPETKHKHVVKLGNKYYEGPVVDWAFEFIDALDYSAKVTQALASIQLHASREPDTNPPNPRERDTTDETSQ